MKQFSQNNEQQLILDYFGQEVATFMDLGANDGVTFSNTHACALRGWSGVCVDASPSAFARLVKTYEGNDKVECHQAMMREGNGMSILHESGEHIGNGDVGLLSTCVPSEKDRWVSTNTLFLPTQVECCTFETLLTRCKLQKFDLISIDIEGMDLEILEQIDLTAVGCRMLIIEVNNRDETPYVTHCAEHGMRAITRNAENMIFIR